MRVGFGSVIFVVCLSGTAPPFAPYHDIAVIQSRVWSGSPFRAPNILCARSFFRSKLFALCHTWASCYGNSNIQKFDTL
jgi:hypothetical protein